MDIVFNVNPLGLEGLGSTLTSLVRNCSNSHELRLWFLCAEFEKKDKLNISSLLKNEKFGGHVSYIDFNSKALFGHLKSLHGDWTTYGRLLIADYVKSDSALYLDSDLIILLDVLLLKGFDFKDAILAAVYSSTVEWALEKNFFINDLKWDKDQGYFNAGVLLFNLKKWRETNVEAQWKKIAAKYPNEFLLADQSLLNAICEGKFARLSPVFNNPWYPGFAEPDDPNSATNSIIHFVGSPKPWDLFAGTIHKGNKTWKVFNTHTWRKHYGKIKKDKITRTWKIRRSIFKLLKKKVLGETE